MTTDNRKNISTKWTNMIAISKFKSISACTSWKIWLIPLYLSCLLSQIPTPSSLKWKGGKYLIHAMIPKIISSETQGSPSFGNAEAVTDKPWGQLPSSLARQWRWLHLGHYPKRQRGSLKWIEMSLIKTCFSASETFSARAWMWPVWSGSPDSKEMKGDWKRAELHDCFSWLQAGTFPCSSLVNRAELVRGEWQTF